VNAIMRVGSAFDSIANASQASVDQAVGAFQTLKKSGRDTEANIKQVNTNIASGFQNTYQGMVQDEKVGVNELAALFREYNTAQTALGDDLSQETKDSFQGIIDQISAITGLGGDQLRQLADDFASGKIDAAGMAAEIEAMGGNVEGAAAAADVLSGAVDQTQKSLDSVDPKPISELVRILKEDGPAAFLATATSVADNLTPALQAMVDAMLPVGDTITPSVDDLGRTIRTVGNDTVKPQADDWRASFENVKNTIDDLITKIGEIPRDVTINVTTTGDGTKLHSGGWAPAPPGVEVPVTLEGGEFVLSRAMVRHATAPLGFGAGRVPDVAGMAMGGGGGGVVARPGYVVAEVEEDLIGKIAVVKVAEAHERGVIVKGASGRYRLHNGYGGRR
jgi:hypothetical protein